MACREGSTRGRLVGSKWRRKSRSIVQKRLEGDVKKRRVRGDNRECCPLFTAAFHAKGTTFERAFQFPSGSVSYVTP